MRLRLLGLTFFFYVTAGFAADLSLKEKAETLSLLAGELVITNRKLHPDLPYCLEGKFLGPLSIFYVPSHELTEFQPIQDDSGFEDVDLEERKVPRSQSDAQSLKHKLHTKILETAVLLRFDPSTQIYDRLGPEPRFDITNFIPNDLFTAELFHDVACEQIPSMRIINEVQREEIITFLANKVFIEQTLKFFGHEKNVAEARAWLWILASNQLTWSEKDPTVYSIDGALLDRMREKDRRKIFRTRIDITRELERLQYEVARVTAENQSLHARHDWREPPPRLTPKEDTRRRQPKALPSFHHDAEHQAGKKIREPSWWEVCPLFFSL